MDKQLFEKLYESMVQMNEIIDGERSPSREFVVDAVFLQQHNPGDRPPGT